LSFKQLEARSSKLKAAFAAAKAALFSTLVLLAAPYIYVYVRWRKTTSKPRVSAGSPVKVAYLRTDFWFGARAGGSVSHIAGFAQGMNELGHRLFFISSDGLQGVDPQTNQVSVIRPAACPPGIPVTLRILAYNIQFFLKSIPILRREKPDVICQRHSILNICGVLLSLLFRIPFMLEYNSSSFWKRESKEAIRMIPVLRLFESINLRAAHKVGVVSEVLKEELGQRLPASRIFVNENGVDARRFSGDIDGAPVREKLGLDGHCVVGFAGIYGPWHGVEHLARAIKYVAARDRNVRFMFVGDKRLKEVVQDIAVKDEVAPRIVLVDAVPHDRMPFYLAACDILCSPHVNMADGSRFFGSPVKLFEYMAMAKPIVASAVEQLSHVLQHRRSAILVQAGDAEAIAQAILGLVEDKGLRDHLGQEARERCLRHFTWRHNAGRFMQNCFGPETGNESMVLPR
jgi:glycosyltransferase involved in cell wall biosynthesis